MIHGPRGAPEIWSFPANADALSFVVVVVVVVVVGHHFRQLAKYARNNKGRN